MLGLSLVSNSPNKSSPKIKADFEIIRDYPAVGTRDLADVQEYLASLPTVPLAELEEEETCSICWMTYAELEPEQHALKLPCGHVFGNQCLETLLGPKPEGWAHKHCPLCRQEVKFNLHMGWVFTGNFRYC